MHTRKQATTLAVIVAVALCGSMGVGLALARYAPTLLWVQLFAAGAFLASYAVIQLRRAAAVKHWQKISVTILEQSIGEHFVPGRGGGHVEYFPEIKFQYVTPTGSNTSSRFTRATDDYRYSDRSKAEEMLNDYPIGAMTSAFLSPADPKLAVLRNTVSDKRHSHYLACLVAGIILVIIALGICFMNLSL